MTAEAAPDTPPSTPRIQPLLLCTPFPLSPHILPGVIPQGSRELSSPHSRARGEGSGPKDTQLASRPSEVAAVAWRPERDYASLISP